MTCALSNGQILEDVYDGASASDYSRYEESGLAVDALFQFLLQLLSLRFLLAVEALG